LQHVPDAAPNRIGVLLGTTSRERSACRTGGSVSNDASVADAARQRQTVTMGSSIARRDREGTMTILPTALPHADPELDVEAGAADIVKG
jgi:hypothetical protein